MPKRSHAPITTDDVVLTEDFDPEDLHAVGLGEPVTNGRQVSLSGLSGILQRGIVVVDTSEDDRIVAQLEEARVSLRNAMRLLKMLNTSDLSDEDIDAMTSIVSFPVNTDALIAYIRQIGAETGKLTSAHQQLLKEVVQRRARLQKFVSDFELNETAVLADTLKIG